MPELAILYAVGCLISSLLTGLFVYTSLRPYRSTPMQVLNLNLAKAGLYWSERRGQLCTRDEAEVEREPKKVLTSALWLGGLMTLMSWAGSAILVLLMLSMTVLARSRTQERLIASPLAHTASMNSEEVLRLLSALGLHEAGN